MKSASYIKIALAAAVAAVSMGTCPNAVAGLSWNFGTGGAFSGVGPNSGDWLSVTLNQVDASDVGVTLSWINVPNGVKLDGLYLNYDKANLSSLTVSGLPSGITMGTGSDKFKADGTGGYYDIQIGGDKQGGAFYQAPSASISFTISASTGHLSEYDLYDAMSVDGANDGWAAIHLIGYSNSVWVNGTDVPVAANPEPPTIIAGAVLLLPLGAGMLQFLRGKRARRLAVAS